MIDPELMEKMLGVNGNGVVIVVRGDGVGGSYMKLQNMDAAAAGKVLGSAAFSIEQQSQKLEQVLADQGTKAAAETFMAAFISAFRGEGKDSGTVAIQHDPQPGPG